MKFENLRLIGFKSFVEPTDFEIREGLTGIVGPNGCGKSNLLESLRWVMGATSAKALRGGSMDEVIFSGTKDRPQRNWAEVILSVENTHHNLPTEFNGYDRLEVSRKILRKEDGSQSIYKVNGKDVRAKDVQLLFADASTGANSPALVRQGQISELINAKPQNRRRLLEEAAGITGLHTRRHESELRLRAAENNIARLDDVTGELETQRKALARQARQASRYRNLSGHIRKAEALSAYLRWREAKDALATLEHDHADVLKLLEETARASAAASNHQTQAHEALEPLRQQEAEAGAALHRLRVAMEQLEAEAKRLQAEKQRLADEQSRLESDLNREKNLSHDATTALEAIQAEEENLRQREAREAERLSEAEALHADAKTKLEAAETAFDAINREIAAHEAERKALAARLQEAQSRRQRLGQEIEKLEAQRETLAQEASQAADLEAAKRAVEDAAQKVQRAEAAAEENIQKRQQAQAQEAQIRAPLQTAQNSYAELKAEADTLQRMLDNAFGGDFEAVLDDVRADAGYEIALAAALGDDLAASSNTQAPAHWSHLGRQDLAPMALPGGVEPLSDYVEAPQILSRRLTQIGIVADHKQGNELAASLQQGQRLVSIDGDVWRWDGFVVRAEAKTAAAMRLEQKNRLGVLVDDLQNAERKVTSLQSQYDEAQENVRACTAEEKQVRENLAQQRKEFSQAQDQFTAIERAAARADSRLQAIEENLTRLGQEIIDIEASLAQTTEQQAALPDIDDINQRLNEAREALADARRKASETSASLSEQQREARSRAQRLDQLAHDRGLWQERLETAHSRLQDLEQRHTEALERLQQVENAPDDFSDKKNALFEDIQKLEARANKARDDFAIASEAALEADRLLKAAEAEAVSAREAKARIEAQHEAAIARLEEATSLAHENCDAAPEDLLDIAEVKPDEDLPTRSEIDVKLEKYKRERENMGGVNLRADQEIEEIDERLSLIGSERGDCEAAIRKLRAAIGNLNREGRQRLLAAFETVNNNFRSLFTRLFGGGQAELRLVDADDPLEAGLEIFASPPGKKLASMSLMSGGEQALTATALIFAVFMANPAPVCVLDEVDAPLDDANVERFCTMLRQMAEETDTRFIIITHHALTMSRMDRLYGVTMIERGVSQLVSVDLTDAEQMVAAE